jgi:tRNA(Ile)-lysidine synthase
MKVTLKPGKYVVAVSGGVDSVALLDVLAGQKGLRLIVAHFDHGIRSDSATDRQLVGKLAAHYGLPFEYAEGQLGADASEEAARTVRYDFLRKVQQKYQTRGIITAHHRDDLLETAVLNLLRGTGRKGLTSLASNREIIRPLLAVSKQEILEYAHEHKLKWREDSTNQNPKYLRNYIRLHIMPRLSERDKNHLLEIIEHSHGVNLELDTVLAELLPAPGQQMERHIIISMPHAIAKELMASWLRRNNLREFDRTTLERLVIAAKTGRPGTSVNVYGVHILRINKTHLALMSFER